MPPSGARLWRLAYRFNGKQKSLALGKYPTVSPLEARTERDTAKLLLRDGKDPPAECKASQRKRSIAGANNFKAIAEEWFEINQGRWVETWSPRLKNRLDDDLLPALGKRPIAAMPSPPLDGPAIPREISGGR